MIEAMERPWFKLALVGVVLLAFFFRFYRLGSVPTALYWDEAAMLVDAKVVAQTGQDMHGRRWLQPLFPSYGDYKLPIYIWLASLSVKFFGVNNFAVRLPSAIVGVATVYLAGLIAAKLVTNQAKHKKWLRLLTSLVVAVSPWSILFSRTAFEGHLAQFLVSLSLYFLLRKKSWLGLTTSVLLGVAATYTYFSVRFVWPPLFLLIYLIKVVNWQDFNLLKLVKPLLFLGLYLLLLLPMFKDPLYPASQQFRYSTKSLMTTNEHILQQNNLRQAAGDSLFNRIIFHRYWLWLKLLAENYSQNLSLNFIFLTGDPNLRHGTGQHGLFLLIFLPFLFLGLFRLLKNKPTNLLILVSWWLLALLPASIPMTTPHALRSLNALMPLSLILGFGLLHFWQFSRRWLKLVAMSLILVSSSAFSYHYFTQYKLDAQTAFQGGYEAAAQKMIEQPEKLKQIESEVDDDRFYLWLWLEPEISAEEIQQTPKTDYKPINLEVK